MQTTKRKETFVDQIVNTLPPETKSRVEQVLTIYLGLNIPKSVKEPKSIAEIPNKIAAIDGQEVANLHANYAAWLAYTQDKLKYLVAIHSVLLKDLDIIYRKALAASVEKTLELRRNEAKISEGYLEVEEVLNIVESVKGMLTHQVSTLDKQMMTMRSELRRRENNTNF